MNLGPELLELKGLYNSIVIQSNGITLIYCKNKAKVIKALEAYEVGVSEHYTIVEE